ncbi:MAG: hypothetical protein NT113_07030 [Hyphomicrobiales bacterium]|nr:hypothetical protein [Hyphomicrobiales bacterium]
MAKVAWLGEPTSEDEGPRQNVWNGITFPRCEEVEIDNSHMIAKARRNPSFSVDGEIYVPDGAEPHPNADYVVSGGKASMPAKLPGPITRDKTELSEMNVAELRAEAAARGVDVEGLSKTEIREKLSAE